MFKNLFSMKSTKKKTASVEEVKPETKTQGPRFIEHEGGQHPSDGQVEKYGLDKTKKYILTKNK